MSNQTWEQRQALELQQETDAYKGLADVFLRVQAVDNKWTMVPSVTDPLRKFHGVTCINGVTVNLGLRKTKGRYDYSNSTYPVNYWIAISIPELMHKYRYTRSERIKWCSHAKWTPSTKGIVKRILTESNELAKLAKVEVDEEIKRKKEEEAEALRQKEFDTKVEQTLDMKTTNIMRTINYGDWIKIELTNLSIEQAKQVQDFVNGGLNVTKP
jgi:hypothetical protein